MFSVRLTGALAACAVLTACEAPRTTGAVTSPIRLAPLFDESVAEHTIGLTPDGPFDQLVAIEDLSVEQGRPAGQALGHIGFAFSPPAGGSILDERYEFSALNVEPVSTFAAKGEVEVHLQSVTATSMVHADVICMSVVGNRARIGAQVERLNEVQVPPGALFAVWTIQDNGEPSSLPGTTTPDIGSLMGFTASGATALLHCSRGFALPQFPNQEGNVQVSPSLGTASQ